MKIEAQLVHAEADHSSWSAYIDEHYDDDVVLTIESFVAYYHNQYYCERPDSKAEFQAEQREMDPDGSLIVLAKQGWTLLKKYLDLCQQYPQHAQEIAQQKRKSRINYNQRGRV